MHFFCLVRKIPYATGNPLTCLFGVVSCPNYTYEAGAWISFSIMTQCLPGNTFDHPTFHYIFFTLNYLFLFLAALFAAAGIYQMSVWALGKHRNYKKEFDKYPKGRKAIFPFIL